MSKKKLKRLVFNICCITEFMPTPPSIKRRFGEEFGWVREILLEVNLPRKKQMVKSHLLLSERLLVDIPELSSKRGGLTCGKNKDFAHKLKRGKESLGHAWGHAFAWGEDQFMVSFSHQHELVYKEIVLNRKTNSTLYQVLTFCTDNTPPSSEFFGIASIICGYFNALLEDKPFFVRDRIRDYIEYRTEEGIFEKSLSSEEKIEKKVLKLPRGIRGIFRAAALIFNTS